MVKIVKYSLLPVVLMVAFSASVIAMGKRPETLTEYTEASQGAIKFYIQTTAFREADGNNFVEFSYSLGFDQLQFITDGQSFRAGYVISVIIYDENGDQVTGDSWEKKLKVRDYLQLQKGDSVITDILRLSVAPGEYLAKIECRDDNSQRQGLMEKVITVPSLRAGFLSSGIRFERQLQDTIIPWPNRIYGEGNGPILLFFRMYSEKPESVWVLSGLTDLSRQKKLWEHKRRVLVSGPADYREAIPTDSLPDGNLFLTIKISDDAGKTTDQIERTLMVRNPMMITKGEFDEKLAEVSYIARRGEMDTLKNASPEKRDSLWKAFWKSRDPTPETEKNEFRDSYFEKINYANTSFGSTVTSGWKSDRGRIYIICGQPDEVEKHSFEIDSYPYEIWYYYQTGYTFVFADKHGFGEYKLVYTNQEAIK